jgi:transcriptional regulator with XRE-family HTH domain
MPLTLKALPCAYTRAVDFRVLREILRRARTRRGLTLDQAAAATGLNRATIHSIENVKREPTLKPELETIEQLVQAYGLTLSSFFTLIERARNPPLKSNAAATDDASAVFELGEGETHGRRRTLDASSAVDILRALREAGAILFNAGLAQPREQPPASRAGTPGRGAARGKPHR